MKILNKDLILLDLFSGMGGFHKGLSDSGFDFKKVYFSEIDKHAIANYKYNYPNAEYIGSVTNILESGIERPNIITFGSPCQDFSLAGKRKGMEGDRSSLLGYALSAVSHFRPDIFIWENVKGTFSSNGGRDFISILQAIADIGLYDCEWQLVNTSWLLPQNRERIYLVGHLATSFRDWKGIFPIGENDELVNKAQQKKESANKIAYTITACSEVKLNLETNYILSKGHDFVEDSVNDICPTIRNSSFEHNTAVLKVNSAMKQGFEEANIGDSINLQFPNSKTRRGRVGKCVAQTLDCNCNQGTIVCGNIRRLTEIECERLQGFPDNWTQYGIYEKKVWINKKENTYKIVSGVQPIPKTQRYKLCGNAVTAKMVELIGSSIISNLKTFSHDK